MQRLASSFRDPAGFLFVHNKILHRVIAEEGKDDYELFVSSGLYEKLAGQKKLVGHREVKGDGPIPLHYKVIRPDPIPFVSYPYEWCFSEFKDAALLTLDIQEEALRRGLSLKDASFFNVQFVGMRPVFIDTLSFEKRCDHPWVAYRQFCQHFLNPLLLMSRISADMGKNLIAHLDGLPSWLTLKILPRFSRLKMGVLVHVWLHALSQKKYEESLGKNPNGRPMGRFDLKKQLALVDSLRSTISSLVTPKSSSEWSDYVAHATHYSGEGNRAKIRFVEQILDEMGPKMVWDLGGNIGEYARLATKRGIYTVCWDLDPACVEENYRLSRQTGDVAMLPLVIDLVNPTPAIGWAHQERMSLFERGPADLVLALALFHHLRITANIPVAEIAHFLARLSRRLAIEYIPKKDPLAQRLILARKDIFHDYTQNHFEAAFKNHMRLVKREAIPDTGRFLYLFERGKQ